MNPDSHSPPSRFFDPVRDHLLVASLSDPPPPQGSLRLSEETSLYLGLFSLTPLFLIFQAWAVVPVLVLCGFALWTVQRLRRERVEAVILHVSSWATLMLGVCALLLHLPFVQASALIPLKGMLYSVVLFGIVLMPLFALLALLYAVRGPSISAKQIAGLSAATLNGIGWAILFIYIGITGLKL